MICGCADSDTKSCIPLASLYDGAGPNLDWWAEASSCCSCALVGSGFLLCFLSNGGLSGQQLLPFGRNAKDKK